MIKGGEGGAQWKAARFQVDPKLASLLGEGYQSSEEALRELVDNVWDADASRALVTLPEALVAAPIVIEVNGTGMTEQELRSFEAYVFASRAIGRVEKGTVLLRSGERSRAEKGIGKFAGLIAANEMFVVTGARGVKVIPSRVG